MTLYRAEASEETYPGLLITEETSAEDIAKFVGGDCTAADIGGDHDGWFVVPAMANLYGGGDVFDGDLVLRLPDGSLSRAVNAFAWEALPE